MKRSTILLLTGFMLVIYLQESSGIKCYTCTGCNDPFEKSKYTAADCAGSCLKVKADKGGVSRSCAPTKRENGCKDGNAGGVSGTVCYCDSDECNTATTSTLSIAAALTTTTGVILYKTLLG